MNASDVNDGLPHLEDYDPEPSAQRGRSGLVLALALTVLAVGAGAALFLDRAPDVPADRPQACAGIEDADLRLSCYDRTVHRVPPQPARGATAILN